MHKTIIRNIILSTLLLTTGLAIADTSPVSESAVPTKINGFYIGGGFLQSFINDDGNDIDYDGFGVNLNAGYKWELNPQWSLGIEAESLYLGQYDNADFGAFAVNAIAEHPFNNKLSVIGKIGTAVEDLTINNIDYTTDSTVILGTSLLYHWTPQWAAYTSYEHIIGHSRNDWSDGDALSVDSIGLGIQYTF